MHRCLPLLKNRRKFVFLSFTNVDPRAPGLALRDRHRNKLLEWNDMHNFKGLTTGPTGQWHLHTVSSCHLHPQGDTYFGGIPNFLVIF
jgi:hypothetical protein